MIHDFYAYYRLVTQSDIDNISNSSVKHADIANAMDTYQKLLLLMTARTDNKEEKKDAISCLKEMLHPKRSDSQHICCKLREINELGIDTDIMTDALPNGSWVIKFQIELEKQFLSKDDVPFYIIDNPVRKDIVFGVPFTSAASWKGNLRWAMMKKFIEVYKDEPEKFAEMRFRHTLLFGSEEGFEVEPRGWTDYLDRLCSGAKKLYRDKLVELFGNGEAETGNVRIEGMLHFYPTFWDRIDLMVINPHDRETKVGRNPIYFEVVPADAKGMFRLLYVPYYWLTCDEKELKEKVLEDLCQVVTGLKAMMLEYGFSAKKTDGFGKTKASWDKSTSQVDVKSLFCIKFSDFAELQKELGCDANGNP
ncbi:RAMP superfamily CRISPR-associated protein [Pseudothermotoga sp. U03pept]|uniref:RAMP superfamily CRISPR-associated protein n=1 Tax=Pseudothermotoga sp. U03pept TaxID=3447012 RepID=UPI003F0112C1